MIQGKITDVLSKIEAVCRRVGRDPSKITLVGVTKFADVHKIKEAIACGLAHIGENKVQEARKKFSCLDDPGHKVTRHLIGHLQSNKVKLALEIFDLIQSVDSLKLAVAIDKQAARLDKVVDILVQVNTAGEEQKFGIDPADAMSLIGKIVKLKYIRLRGLMTIAPYAGEEPVIRKCFRDLRLLSEQTKEQFSSEGAEMKYLSMGMTDDYHVAIEEGSNMLRVGRAIFQ